MKKSISPTANEALDPFRDVRDEMIWKGAALKQLEEVQEFADGLGFPWEVVGHHTSKSIKLPVVRITCGDSQIYLRDNFHDINVCVVSEAPFATPMFMMLEGIINAADWEWYLGEVSKARNYSWKKWSDEQMDTPGLVALSNDAPSYSVKSLDEKARWAKRMTDPEWWGRDWSAGEITWEGDFGPDVTMWVQRRPFMEGITALVPESARRPYEPGCKAFAMALYSWERAGILIRRITGEIAA